MIEVLDRCVQDVLPLLRVAEQNVAVTAQKATPTFAAGLRARATPSVVVDGEVGVPASAGFVAAADGADSALFSEERGVLAECQTELGAQPPVLPLYQWERVVGGVVVGVSPLAVANEPLPVGFPGALSASPDALGIPVGVLRRELMEPVKTEPRLSSGFDASGPAPSDGTLPTLSGSCAGVDVRVFWRSDVAVSTGFHAPNDNSAGVK